ncbi:putative reverse transcriptase domain-containing protein, partial [Tanacetum coccineum]
MPFRLTNTPASKEDHKEHLKIILGLLEKEKLYTKFLKCDFWLNSVKFLCHVIDSKGIHVDPSKIEAIKNWDAPTTPTEVRQFLGLAGYYLRFIKGFSLIAKPLTKLTQMNKNKANVVADALSRKEREKQIRVRALVMTVYPDLSERILKAQTEAMKKENVKAENLGRLSDYVRVAYVEAEHQKPSGLLQQPEILEWKWEKIIMDFVSGLPRTPSGYDTIWVIVDRLTKSAHFLPMKTTDSIEKLTQQYLKEIVCRHGVLVSIISYRDSRFALGFWRSLQKALGTHVNISTAYHPETDGQ